MKFQKKVFWVYVILGVLISGIAGVIYYSMSKSRFIEQEYQGLDIAAKQLNLQYENMIESMEDVSWYLLSDEDTLSAILALAHLEKNPRTNTYIQEGVNRIRTMMSTDYLNQRFYRVIYYNQRGYTVASNNWGSRELKSDVSWQKFPWHRNIKSNKGEIIIQGIHKDPWGEKSNPEVFSVIKNIQGKNMGFIEVQVTRKDLEKIFQVPNDALHICLMKKDGTVLYKSQGESEEFYEQFIEEQEVSTDKYRRKDGSSVLVAGMYHEALETFLIVTKDASILEEKMTEIYVVTMILTVGILLFSLFYIVFTSKKLTKPMEQLRILMKNTYLENLNESMELDGSMDEFKELAQTYEEMRVRLNRAIIRAAHMSTLQLRAQFDVLQAQVNPHFLYNVLNIISNRGLMNDDEVICDMCDDLAGMIRYATSTKEKYATISEEINYLNQYFALLKYRYEYKLQYQVQIETDIYSQIVPKIVFQQLVENSISHGFENSNKVMNISVNGWKENGYWYVRVRDNGDGFKEGILRQLQERIDEVRRNLSTNRTYIELEIGGMGIVNTFARFYLLNMEDVVFEFGNWENGAQITVGGKVDLYVSDFGGRR